MVPVELISPSLFEEFGMLAPMLTFNPFTMFQTVVLGGLTFAALGLG